MRHRAVAAEVEVIDAGYGDHRLARVVVVPYRARPGGHGQSLGQRL